MTKKGFNDLFEKWARRTKYEYAKGSMYFVNWVHRRHPEVFLESEESRRSVELVRRMAAAWRGNSEQLFESDIRFLAREACAIIPAQPIKEPA